MLISFCSYVACETAPLVWMQSMCNFDCSACYTFDVMTRTACDNSLFTTGYNYFKINGTNQVELYTSNMSVCKLALVATVGKCIETDLKSIRVDGLDFASCCKSAGPTIKQYCEEKMKVRCS